MCVLSALTALGTAVGGATGAAATAATGLQTLGLVTSVGGSLWQGISSAQAYSAQMKEVARQKATERALTATKEQRTRLQFSREIRRQATELAARGINLASPTAVALGQTAAQEMSFAAQGVRAEGAATQAELTSTQRVLGARRASSLLKGTTTAAGAFLRGAPDIWPELLA